MALDPLATTADLAARGITIPAGMDATTLLKSASEAVRDAAGIPISQITSTVDLTGSREHYLELPGGPVTAVTSVLVNGDNLTDYVLRNGMLYRDLGWQFFLPNWTWVRTPALITVTYTHGYATVPDDVIDLVCSLVAQRATQGYDNDPRVTSEQIDDYRVNYAAPQQVAIPDDTRQWLRDKFANNAYVTGHRW